MIWGTVRLDVYAFPEILAQFLTEIANKHTEVRNSFCACGHTFERKGREQICPTCRKAKGNERLRESMARKREREKLGLTADEDARQ